VRSTTRSEFDQYAREYLRELSHPLRDLIDPEGQYFIELKSDILKEIASQYFPHDRNIKIVDVGTGLGLFEKFLYPHFDNIAAIDISFEMLKVAQTLNPLKSRTGGYVQGNAFQLPLENGYADLVFMSCVMHHLEEADVQSTLSEIARICSPRGIIIFFEHNPYNPITQLVVRTTPLDRNARLVSYKKLMRSADKSGIHIEEKQFFLYGTRKIDKLIRKNISWLGKVPFGGQYALMGQKDRTKVT
jgi:ubiquinone/menaquinone biosynthesis C-methylase UbiE